MSTAPMVKAPDQAKVVVGPCVMSFPNLFKARAVKPGDPLRYGASFIFDVQKDRPQLLMMRNAVLFVLGQRWKNVEELIAAGRLHLPWRRGEERDGPGYGPGKIFINANSDQPPGVVDRNVQPILDAREIYPGVIVIASMRAFTYDQKGNRGASFGLNHVQKHSDGPRIDNRSTPSQDFKPLGDDPLFGTGSSTDDMFS